MIDGSFGADSGSETPHRAESGEGSDGAVDGAEDVAFDAPEEGPATVESLGDPDVSSTGATAEDVRFDAPDENHQNDEHPPAADDPTEDNTPHTANDALAETGAEDQDQDAPVDPWSTDSTDAAPTGTTESAEGREDPGRKTTTPPQTSRPVCGTTPRPAVVHLPSNPARTTRMWIRTIRRKGP